MTSLSVGEFYFFFSFLWLKMGRIFLFVLLLPIILGKCGLYWNYAHSSSREDNQRTGGLGSRYATWGFGFGHGFGYQSLSSIVTCNDVEMFEQCKRAQFLLDMQGIGEELNCAHNIVCSAAIPGNGKFWCQNLDAYDLCLHAQALSNTTIICSLATKLSDDIAVLDYRESAATQPPTTPPTTPPTDSNMTTTTSPPTTTPCLASAIRITVAFALFVVIL